MVNFRIATQLAVGTAERAAFTDTQIEEAIALARGVARVDALMLWPSAQPGLTGRLARACRLQGIRPLLWFPVLCDLPGGPPPGRWLVESCTGGRGHGTSGAWPGLAAGDEHFLFACPNDDRFVDHAFRAYVALLDAVAPDGVMLDRIRFPGSSNGFEALLGCFCDSCRARYRAETGSSITALRDRACGLLAELRARGPAGFLARWAERGSPWKAAGLEELAAFRERSIARLAGRFARLARSRGLEVGLDLFSPSLAPLVGQDYRALSEACDWVKPMTYRQAVGPAGLPLELASLRRGLRELSPGSRPPDLARLFGWAVPDSDDELLARGLSEEVIASELATLATTGMRAGTRVYAGLEAVRVPRLGIDVTPERLWQGLRAACPPAHGVIASWNLLHIPRENLEVLGVFAG
jgi:hypothetical protein